MTTMDPPFEASVLRTAFGCFPCGVIAVCGMLDGAPVGLAASKLLRLGLVGSTAGLGVRGPRLLDLAETCSARPARAECAGARARIGCSHAGVQSWRQVCRSRLGAGRPGDRLRPRLDPVVGVQHRQPGANRRPRHRDSGHRLAEDLSRRRADHVPPQWLSRARPDAMIGVRVPTQPDCGLSRLRRGGG
jgi:hypothetical protein